MYNFLGHAGMRGVKLRTERQMATLEVWGGRGNQTPAASPEATAIGW